MMNLLDEELRDEKDWKGRVRLFVEPVRFYHLKLSVGNQLELIDICPYIGGSDIVYDRRFDKESNTPSKIKRLVDSLLFHNNTQLHMYLMKVAIVLLLLH